MGIMTLIGCALSLALVKILSGISTLGWKPTWDSLLSNGTANYPNGSYQTGIVYGDYYYIRVSFFIRHSSVVALSMQQPAPGHWTKLN